MPVSLANGLSYYYEIGGAGEPLVLLHGFCGSSASWTGLFERFSLSQRVLALDLPGHGRTEAPARPDRYAMEAVARDVAAICAAEFGVPVGLLGYSMGGRLALYLAWQQPALVERLILESASPGLQDEEDRWRRQQSDESLAHRLEAEGVEAFVRFWEGLPLFESQQRLPPAIIKRQRQVRLSGNAQGLANSLRGMGSGRQPALWDALPAIGTTALLVTGAEDRKFAEINRRMTRSMPAATLVEVANAGHNVHLEQESVFGDLVVAFLEAGQQRLSGQPG